MSCRVRTVVLILALALLASTAARAQSQAPEPKAPWSNYPTDPAKIRITMEVLHFPNGPNSDVLPISGFMVSYVGLSGSVFVHGAQAQFVDSLTARYGAQSIYRRTMGVEAGQTLEAESVTKMTHAVSEDQVPPGFLLGRSELGVSLAVHPLYDAKKKMGSVFVRFMARTALPSEEGAGRAEMDQINVDWFAMGYDPGFPNVVIFPQVLVLPEEEGGEVWGRQPETPVRSLRYALVFRVDVEGVEPLESDPADPTMAVLMLAPPGSDMSLESLRAAQLLSAIAERTGMRIQVLGDTISPDRILSGDTPVIIAYPQGDPLDQLSAALLRSWALAKALGVESALDPPVLLSAMEGMTEPERAEYRQQVLNELEEAARRIDDLLAMLQADSEEAAGASGP